ncbi:MAG: hypothetical protein ABSH28_16240 [Acidobacteriota bacterium]|jgi:hypothetical protein
MDRRLIGNAAAAVFIPDPLVVFGFTELTPCITLQPTMKQNTAAGEHPKAPAPVPRTFHERRGILMTEAEMQHTVFRMKANPEIKAGLLRLALAGDPEARFVITARFRAYAKRETK